MDEATNKELREKFQRLMDAPPPPPFEVTRKFLSIYFCDADGWDEAIADIKQFALQTPNVIAKDLQGLEKFLAVSQEKDVLSNLVAWEANWVLENPSDEGAREWPQRSLKTVRDILGDKAPPRS